jgi:hypothetical protein
MRQQEEEPPQQVFCSVPSGSAVPTGLLHDHVDSGLVGARDRWYAQAMTISAGDDDEAPRWRFLAVVAACAPLALFFVIEAQRPLPFSTTNDNWSYFLPLMLRVQDAWLSGGPLRVVWELGQGWSPWDSGQVGWLYPVPLIAALVVRLVGDRLLFLEVDSFVHLVLLGAAAWWCAPPSLRGRDRAAFVWLLALAPGPFLVGMNWHDYLMPAPWFVVLLGMCWRAVSRATPWTRRESVVVVVVSLLFFSAAHPHMFVLGCAFLALFTLVAAVDSEGDAARAVGVDVVVRLAFAQLPALPALVYLARAADSASLVWQAVREKASLLEGSATAGQGVVAVVFGPWLTPQHAPIFAPLLLVMFVVAIARRRPLFVVVPVLLLVLVVPRVFPPIHLAFVGPLASFRFPEKLAVYVGPVLAALWFVLGQRDGSSRRAGVSVFAVAAVVVGALSAIVIVVGNDAATTMRSAHPRGAAGLAAEAEQCLQQAGVARGDRIAFADDIPHDRDWAKYPLLLPALFNHAPLLYGRESVHVYEPLEPDELAVAHARMTAFWRSPGVDVHDDVAMTRLRDSGADWLVSLKADHLAPLPTTTACGLSFARLPAARAFPGDDLVADARGDLWTKSTTLTTPPATPTLARTLTWTRADDGRWRGRQEFPSSLCAWATLVALVVSVALVARSTTMWPGLRRLGGLVGGRRGPE